MFGASISAEKERVKLQVKTPVKQLKNSLAKKVVRPGAQNHKRGLASTAETLRGAQPRLGAEQAWGGQVTERGGP